MDIYTLDADANRYQNLVLQREEDWNDLLDWFHGEPIADAWRPIAVKVLRDNKFNRNLPTGDFPALSAATPVFSERAVRVLEDFLRPNGEILPLESPEGRYFVFNTTRLTDALDIEHSEVEYYTSGAIMWVARYSFLPEKVAGLCVFKVSQMHGSPVFVSHGFVDRAVEAKLAGFDFRHVWSGPDA